ncbi:hypothetical protein DUNSADRAFT_11345 [Dunaliella salina]|uniref:Uncharacterized protein n=1 Tax=Dunaliella salina TaxID=3046 RepID=A0ABQ7GDL7_DUNSA|nr:hypothetical protein DUNSADRAFT_11345 [Dunaliella salina]|eukprot:KAF5832701.1 hypothetical protein DUNSADRAFT_11345 [Dunaliella salina]
MLLHSSGKSCSLFNLTPQHRASAPFTPLHRVVTRRQQPRFSQPCIAGAASSSFSSGGEPAPEGGFQPFPRTRERNPYKLLGLSKDASFEEVQNARNFLYEQYRWHEPSRESIELAFEAILKETYKARRRFGFRPPRTGRREDIIGDPDVVPLSKKIRNMFDPTVTARTLVNEGAVYIGLALWTLFSSDQSFPLAGAFAYSVYRFQSKRIKANPEGPFFGGNAIVGAVLTTAINIAIACAVMSFISAPLANLLDSSMRQVGGCFVILIAGALAIYLK